jgi:hypothetical protein
MKAEQTVKAQTQQDADVSSEPKLSIVKFHQTKIQCIVDPDGSINVALKPIMDAIGLHADSAWKSIKNDPILGAKHGVRRGLDAKKREFPMQTLPIEYVHGWLFSIDSSKVSAQAKPKLLKFKEECYQVLFDHFYGKYRFYEDNLRQRRSLQQKLTHLIDTRKELNAEITALNKQISELQHNELIGQYQLRIGGNK